MSFHDPDGRVTAGNSSQITDGSSAVDASMLTGESDGIRKQVRDR